MDPRNQTGRPFDVDRPSRVLPGLNVISPIIRKTVVTIAEASSPSRSEFDLESANSTLGLPEKLRRWSSHHKSADLHSARSSLQVSKKEPRTIMTLPHELQIIILSFLEFGDIERLRRTAKHWYNFATPRLVRSIHGPDTFRAILIQHCRVCLTYCPKDVTRIVTTRLDAGYPLSSRCIRCTVQSEDGTIRIGRKVTLGNFTDYWTCRWCGWPITTEPSRGHDQFHQNCYEKYAIVLLAFFCLGWVQFFIGIVAAALSWHYFPRNRTVLAPTIVGFLLTWVCIVLILLRGNKVRTYHLALLIELAIVGLWIPPIYQIGKDFATRDLELPTKPAAAIMAFVGLNMLFRVFNIIGNVILISDYDRTRHYVPRIPIWRRFMNPFLTALIFWTYPQHAERKFPPDWA